jgi:hypothetical protein
MRKKARSKNSVSPLWNIDICKMGPVTANQRKDKSKKTNGEEKKFLCKNDKMWQRSKVLMEVWQEKINIG